MKNIKTLAVFAILLSVILVAGCLGGDKTKGQAGFGEDSLDVFIDTEGRSTFDSGEEFTITIDAENFGPFDVSDVNTSLIGFGGLSLTDPDPGEKLSHERKLSSFFGRPQPELDVSGGFGTEDWEVTAPTVSEDSPDVNIRLTGQVFYRTKSLGVQKVVVADKDYLVQMEERGETVPVNPVTDALNGPVSLDVEVPNPYVIVRADKESSFVVKIMLNNDGSGNVYARPTKLGGGKDRDYLENVTITYPANVGLTPDIDGNCDFELDAGNKIKAIDTKLRMMSGGASRDLSCEFKLDADSITGYQTFEFYAQTEYTYLQDVVTDIVIEGTN
jgi:hypothetical protein